MRKKNKKKHRGCEGGNLIEILAFFFFFLASHFTVVRTSTTGVERPKMCSVHLLWPEISLPRQMTKISFKSTWLGCIDWLGNANFKIGHKSVAKIAFILFLDKRNFLCSQIICYFICPFFLYTSLFRGPTLFTREHSYKSVWGGGGYV